MEKKIDLIIGSRKMQKSLTQVLITKLEDYFILKEEISLGNIGLALIHVRDINNEFLKNFSSTCCQQAIRQIYINERDKLIYSFVTSIQQNEHSWVREKILTTLATPDRIHLADCINQEIKERIEGVGIDENQRTCLQLGILTVVKKDSAVLI